MTGRELFCDGFSSVMDSHAESPPPPPCPPLDGFLSEKTGKTSRSGMPVCQRRSTEGCQCWLGEYGGIWGWGLWRAGPEKRDLSRCSARPPRKMTLAVQRSVATGGALQALRGGWQPWACGSDKEPRMRQVRLACEISSRSSILSCLGLQVLLSSCSANPAD